MLSGDNSTENAIQELSNLRILFENENQGGEPEGETFVTKELWPGGIMFLEELDTSLIDWTGVSDIFL
jgi:hypothetical protein